MIKINKIFTCWPDANYRIERVINNTFELEIKTDNNSTVLIGFFDIQQLFYSTPDEYKESMVNIIRYINFILIDVFKVKNEVLSKPMTDEVIKKAKVNTENRINYLEEYLDISIKNVIKSYLGVEGYRKEADIFDNYISPLLKPINVDIELGIEIYDIIMN